MQVCGPCTSGRLMGHGTGVRGSACGQCNKALASAPRHAPVRPRQRGDPQGMMQGSGGLHCSACGASVCPVRLLVTHAARAAPGRRPPGWPAFPPPAAAAASPPARARRPRLQRCHAPRRCHNIAVHPVVRRESALLSTCTHAWWPALAVSMSCRPHDRPMSSYVCYYCTRMTSMTHRIDSPTPFREREVKGRERQGQWSTRQANPPHTRPVHPAWRNMKRHK